MGGEESSRLRGRGGAGVLPALRAGGAGLLRRPELTLGAAACLVVLAPHSAFIGFPQLDVMRVAVLLPAIPMLLGASRLRMRLALSDLALLAFLVVALGTWVAGSSAENPRLVLAMLLPLGFYLWGRLVDTEAAAITILWALVLAGALAALTVLWEYVVARQPLFVEEASYYWREAPGVLFRPGGVFGSPPGAALVLSMVALGAAPLAILNEGWRRIAVVGSLAIVVAAVAVTFTRGSYLGLAVAGAGFAALMLPRKVVRRALMAGVVIAAAVAVSSPLWLDSAVVQEGLVRESSVDWRLANWETAVDFLGVSPQTLAVGEGFPSLLLAREEYGAIPVSAELPQDSLLITDGPHNQYLLVAIETGVAGLLALVAWLGSAVVAGTVGAYRATNGHARGVLAGLSMAVVAFAVAGLFGDHLRYDTAVAVVALLSGMLVSAVQAERRPDSHATLDNPPSRAVQ